ncbi:MAG TPA: zinc ribbon domain-containing protein [Anaerolineales bacterium]
MRKWLILLTVLVMLFPSSAQAQTPVALESLKVLLWSEYDQPSMLVIYDFTLTDATQVPTTMDVRFPRDANITAVAFNSGGELLLANYQTQPEQDANWQVITLFVTERTNYHIEYYQPLERDGDQRSFTYQWTGDYSINDFDVEVQVPDDSKGVKTDPAIPLVQNQPFLSGGAMMSGLAQGEPYQLQLEYSRSRETVAATPISSQVEPIAPVDENTDGRSTLDNLPLFLGGFGVALILAALFYFFRGQSPIRTPKPRKRSHGPQEPSMASYCPECGTRSHDGDRFCRACGSKLR